MLTLLLLACDIAPDTGTHGFSDASNLCGRIERDSGAPAASGVNVVQVLDGETACVGGDTGGAGWWGDVVESPAPDGDFFEATVPAGSYGVEVYAGPDYSGCSAAVVADDSTCSADIVVRVSQQFEFDKPNLYLYPTERTDVSVRLPAWRQITESDPRYPVDGWRVTAWPDGELDTRVGERDFLFYEMNYDVGRLQQEQGWCVRGPLAQLSIESEMKDIGFLPTEIRDFATAWDGEFPETEWMTIYPQFTHLATVKIDPEPDSFLRAWYYVAPGCRAVEPVQPPDVVRTGFHAAEWGVGFESPLDAPDVVVHGG